MGLRSEGMGTGCPIKYLTRFADMEMAIVAVEIFSRFSLQPTEDEEEVTPVYGFVTKPNKEIFVNVNTI